MAAEEAVAETAQVARAGHREVSTRENSMFNLLTSFAATSLARVVSRTCCECAGRSARSARSVWAGTTSTTSCRAS